MTFAEPAYLLLFAVVGALAAVLLWIERWRARARVSFLGPQAPRWPSNAGRFQALLLLTAASLVVLAAARPQWGSREFQRERQGVDLVIALDISQSMQAQDVDPSRLALAQSALIRLVESLRGSRIGLVLFAGTAVLRSPLTTDTQAMTQLIRRAEHEAGLTSVGSDLGAALDQASRILTASESPGRAVLVVSDGEDHVGAFTDQASELAADGVVIFSAGVGTPEGSTLTEVDPETGESSLKVDAAGQPVVTRLDEANLRAIAGEGGGYSRLDASGTLLSLRDDLARLDQTPLADETQSVPIERFQWFLGAALALLALTWLLPARLALPRFVPRPGRPRPGLALLVLALILAACAGDELRDDNAAANRLFEAGDFEAALEAYETLLAQRPDLPELSFNAGNTLHRLERFDRAVAETQRALPPTTTELGAATYYTLGNHLFALGSFEQAFDSFRNALLLDPDDADAKHNLELTLLLLQQAQQPDQPPPDADQQPGGQPPEPPQPGEPGDQDEPRDPADGTPTGDPTDDDTAPGDPTAAALRSLQEALAGIDEELTFEEAVRILDLLRQQRERQRPSSSGDGPAGPDY